MALSVGHFLTYPMDSFAALKNLPAGVAALIASSPEYFERFRHMTRGEQIQAVAECLNCGAWLPTARDALTHQDAQLDHVEQDFLVPPA